MVGAAAPEASAVPVSGAVVPAVSAAPALGAVVSAALAVLAKSVGIAFCGIARICRSARAIVRIIPTDYAIVIPFNSRGVCRYFNKLTFNGDGRRKGLATLLPYCCKRFPQDANCEFRPALRTRLRKWPAEEEFPKRNHP